MNRHKVKLLILLSILMTVSKLLGQEQIIDQLTEASDIIAIAEYKKTSDDGYNVYQIKEILKGVREEKLFEWPSPLVVNRGNILIFEGIKVQSVFEISHEGKIFFLKKIDGVEKIVAVSIVDIKKKILTRKTEEIP